MPERIKCKECDIKKAVGDIEYMNNISIRLDIDNISTGIDIDNVNNFLYNLKQSSSFAHKVHTVLRDS